MTKLPCPAPRDVSLAALGEPARLAVIAGLGLPGHLGDGDLDAIVATAAQACQVPIAVLTIVTPGRQTYPAEQGIGVAVTQVPDALSFCAEVVATGRELLVADARAHPVYRDNPLVVSGAVAAYAGVPLHFDGQVIGALSVIDATARRFTEQHLALLRAQAQLANAVLRLRTADLSGAGATGVGLDPGCPDAPRAQELRRGIAAGELVVHYHPVMELESDRMVGVEALVRWAHPTRGLLPPARFIDLAERTGLIGDLGQWVLRAAAAQAAAWAQAGHPLEVAVNLSPRQMADPRFAEHVQATLAKAGVPGHRIVLEVTESALLDQPHAARVLAELRDHGIRLALDDFGTGYASFPYLRRFPIDIIKIDRSFVAGLGRHPDDEAIVASIVGLAHGTGKTVIAEGIAEAGQLDRLRALGAAYGQGFLWTEPLPGDQILAWAEAHARSGRALSATGTREMIMGMHAAGSSHATIAAALNAQGRRTHDGLRWQHRSVASVLARAAHARG